MKIAFVIPIFNERETLAELTAGILEHVQPHDARIYFVDDGSDDGSRDVMQELAEHHAEVTLIPFRRNMGKSTALEAGFEHADGEIVFTMDGDLQDDPKEISRFLEKLDEGYDLVCGWKAVRHDPWHKTFPSKVYNSFVAKTFGLDLHDVNCGFKAMRMNVAKALRIYGDMHRLVPVLAVELGFKVTEIPVEHHPRRWGVSKYGFERFSRGAMDVLTLWFLFNHSHSPGHFFGKLGIGSGLAGGVVLLAGLVAGLVQGVTAVSVIALIVGAACITGGMALVGIGLLGELLVRHHESMETGMPWIEDDQNGE